jgi:poly(ADP-ribose) glycohydrolase ARH3
MKLDHFQGCLLGLALGDALGAPFEGGPLERLAWRLIGKTRHGQMRWTDDTQMSLDIAKSLIINSSINPDDLARRFAQSYHWSRGYGPGAARLLKKIAKGADWRQANRLIFPTGSYGNGAAMRAPLIGLFYFNKPDLLNKAATDSAMITHAHPLGLEGAVIVANATTAAVQGADGLEQVRAASAYCKHNDFLSRFEIALEWLNSKNAAPSKQVAKSLGNGIAATHSCVTAVYLAARFQESSFLTMMQFIKEMRGDVDTISAMAGAIWGASRGFQHLPPEHLTRLEKYEVLMGVASQLHSEAIKND